MGKVKSKMAAVIELVWLHNYKISLFSYLPYSLFPFLNSLLQSFHPQDFLFDFPRNTNLDMAPELLLNWPWRLACAMRACVRSLAIVITIV